jgi:hypothetical protein
MWWSFEHDAHLGALDDPARYYTAILTANDTGEAIEEVLEKLR